MPQPLSPAGLRKRIASGALDPLYLITGDDEAEKSLLAAELPEVIDEGLRAFNVDRLYGGESGATVAAIIEAARTLPMMAPRRLVVVLRAERLLMPKRESEAAEADLEALGAYIEQPEPLATVAFVSRHLDKNRRITKRLVKHAVVVMCGVLESGREAEEWLRKQAAERKMTIEPAAARLLVQRAGLDMVRLRADAERALLFAAGRGRVTPADVEAVTAGATSQDEWAVTNAIQRGDARTALRELGLVLDGGAVPYMVLGQLGWVARTKLPPARIPEAIEAVFRTDIDLKSSAGDPRVLLERLVVELCGW
jgi:DNA polymerase-3 subunit delta